jgi:hypothetical protein
MTKTYIVPCIMEFEEPSVNAFEGRFRTQIGPWEFWVAKFNDTQDILDTVGVEVDFDKMARRGGRSEKFTRAKFVSTVRELLNKIVNGEPR